MNHKLKPWNLIYFGDFRPTSGLHQFLQVASLLQTELKENIHVHVLGPQTKRRSEHFTSLRVAKGAKEFADRLNWTDPPTITYPSYVPLLDREFPENSVFLTLSQIADQVADETLRAVTQIGAPTAAPDFFSARSGIHCKDELTLSKNFLFDQCDSALVRAAKSFALARKIQTWKSALFKGEKMPIVSRRKTLVIRPGCVASDWQSLRSEILPALEFTWRAKDSSENTMVLDEDSASFFQDLTALPEADTVVLLKFSPQITSFIRNRLRRKSKFIIYSHGEAMSSWAEAGGSLLKNIRSDDLFIVACEAEKLALSRIMPRVRCVVRPFPLQFLPHFLRPVATRVRKPRRLLYAGRLAPHKNLEILLEGIGILKRQGLKVNLDVFGAPEGARGCYFQASPRDYQGTLEKLCHKFKIDTQVKFRGTISPDQLVKEILATPGVFVSPSLNPHENFGAAAFACLWHGAGAVLTSWGGHLELSRLFRGQVRLVDSVREKGIFKVRPLDLATAIAPWFTDFKEFETKICGISHDLRTEASCLEEIQSRMRIKRPGLTARGDTSLGQSRCRAARR